MDSINIRYGETVTLPFDANDSTAVSADIYIGKPGQMYVLTKSISLVAGEGTFVLSTTDTKLPLGTYYYQINVTDANGYIEKYPSSDEQCDDCDGDLPEFTICEAIDEIEVS